MAELLCSALVVPYSEVKKFDEMIQAFLPHSEVFASRTKAQSHTPNARKRHFVQEPRDPVQSGEEMNAMTTLFLREKGMFHSFPCLPHHSKENALATQILHKHFFARAMLDKKHSPFDGPYATSVLATYRSAIILQGLFTRVVQLFPDHSLRMHDMWSMSVICGVSCPLAQPVFSYSICLVAHHWRCRMPRLSS